MQSFLVIFNYCLSRFISYLLSFENLVIEYRMYIACEQNCREFFTDEKRRPAGRLFVSYSYYRIVALSQTMLALVIRTSRKFVCRSNRTVLGRLFRRSV